MGVRKCAIWNEHEYLRTVIIASTPAATSMVTVTEDFLGSRYCAECFPVSRFMEFSQNPKWWVLAIIPDNKGENGFRKIEHLTQGQMTDKRPSWDLIPGLPHPWSTPLPTRHHRLTLGKVVEHPSGCVSGSGDTVVWRLGVRGGDHWATGRQGSLG